VKTIELKSEAEAEEKLNENIEEDKETTPQVKGDSALLKEVIAYDSSSCQWPKLILSWSLITILTIISFLRREGE